MSRVQGSGFRTFSGNIFFDHFLDPATKPRSQGSKPRSFHDRASVPSTRSENQTSHTNFSTRIHLSTSKNKISCRFGERDLFLSPVPPVLPLMIFSKEHDFWKTKTPEKTQCKIIFDHRCPSAPMSFFWGRWTQLIHNTLLRRYKWGVQRVLPGPGHTTQTGKVK